MRLQSDTVILKHDIAYIGIIKSTDLGRVSLPAVERNRFDHPKAFYLIRSTMDVNKSRLRRPKCSGRPRYLPMPPSLLIFRILLAIFRVLLGVFDEKDISNF